MYYRFVQGSVTEYKRWRRSTGYHLRDLDELLDPWSIDVAYQYYFDAPFPADPDVESLFDTFWSVGLELGDGTNRPVSIASERKGLCAVTGVLTAGNPEMRSLLGGELGAELWHGTISTTMRCWWMPPVNTHSLIARDGRVRYADVGMVLKYADGSRKPLVLTMLRDPKTSTWFLEHVVVYNYPTAALSALEY